MESLEFKRNEQTLNLKKKGKKSVEIWQDFETPTELFSDVVLLTIWDKPGYEKSHKRYEQQESEV